MPAHRYMEDNGSAVMLAAKKSVSVAPEVKHRECVTHIPLPSVHEAAHSDFGTQRNITRSPKQGYQWPHKKDLCPPKM